MMLPNFELPSWEAGILGEDEPLCAPATRRLEVKRGWKKTTYLARETIKRGRIMVLVQREMPNAPTLHLQFPVDYSNPSKAFSHFQIQRSDEEIEKSIRERQWQRVLHFNSDLELLKRDETAAHTFYVTGDNRTWWLGKDLGVSFEFLLDGRPRRNGWGEILSATRIEFLINKANRNKNSDCHFSLRWGALTNDEKLRWLYEFEHGNFDEYESVLRCFVVSGSWWDGVRQATFPVDMSDEPDPKRRLPYSLAESRLLVIPIAKSGTDVNAEWIPFSASQRQLLSVLDQYFGLHYNEECWCHKRLGLHRFASWLIQVMEVPTHHERLEARHQLRDWLQGKVAPQEIPFLLGEAQ